MKKIKTIKKNYEFKRILTKGKAYGSSNITIFILENKKEENRIGIAVSVKVAKAVKRNRIKRLIRESYRCLENNLEKGHFILIIWNKKANIETVSYGAIQKDMLYTLKKARIYKEKQEV